MKGLIIENISNLYKVKSDKKIYDATARGKFKQEGVTPLVGDIVDFDLLENRNEIEAVITNIKPRTSELKRPKVANITQIIFMISTKNPKPDLLMLDKQLAYAEYLKIKPAIIINKTDLSDTYKHIQEIYSNIGYKTIATNAKEKIGTDEVKEILKNKISAFSGNSGVGKSTTINAIFGTGITAEGEISHKNKKGKNTTTSVKLYEVDSNSYIVDTPGFANFELSEIESKDLENYFIDLKPYIQNCEFVGCTHIKEQNCGIKHALEDGKISQERYQNYCKIYLELKDKEERKW
ncbi:MAG: ribosome small subunit-dependent GTPase A [Clostridia bacterium]|nr:ribosome small subunit-dependent GTPase A [Clostridia bacterium]